MLVAKRSAGIAPEVPSVNQAAHSGFETQRRHHQKSKTWVSVAPQKDLPKIKKETKSLDLWGVIHVIDL